MAKRTFAQIDADIARVEAELIAYRKTPSYSARSAKAKKLNADITALKAERVAVAGGTAPPANTTTGAPRPVRGTRGGGQPAPGNTTTTNTTTTRTTTRRPGRRPNPPAPAPVVQQPVVLNTRWLGGIITLIAILLLAVMYLSWPVRSTPVDLGPPRVTVQQAPALPPDEQPAPQPERRVRRVEVQERQEVVQSKPLSEMTLSECTDYWLLVRGKVVEGYGNHHWDSERGCIE